MSLINYVTKVAHCKIIYYGPGLSGKTTNIQYVYEHTQQEQRTAVGNASPVTRPSTRCNFGLVVPPSAGHLLL